jgi:hypothetical protein
MTDLEMQSSLDVNTVEVVNFCHVSQKQQKVNQLQLVIINACFNQSYMLMFFYCFLYTVLIIVQFFSFQATT